MKIRIIKPLRPRPGVFCFCTVLNEEWFLPHFLAHYRRLGISYFIFYDDGSTDRTLEILLAQEDCLVIAREGEKVPGSDAMTLQTRLINAVPESVGAGAWSLSVDADEFLVLPSRFSTIGELVDYLDQRSLKCAFAAMLDFYPEQLSGRLFDPLPPFEGSRWLDRDPGFLRKPHKPQPLMVAAGVRVRLLKMLAERHPERLKQIYRKDHPYRFAKLWKVPLLKTGSGIRRTDPHNVSIVPPMGLQLALAHFKFYPAIDQKVAEALERRTHFLGAIEYEFLRAVIELFPDELLVTERSVEYRSPTDLEDAGLIWAD